MERKHFLQEVKDRFHAPWTAIFAGYFAILIGAGLVSVGITILDVAQTGKIACENFKIAESIGTFFFGIVATSFVDLNLCERLQNKKAFMMWSYILAGFSIFLLWITFQLKSPLSFLPSFVGTILALFIWVIANADNDKIIQEDNFFDEMRGGDKKHGSSWTE